MLYLNEVSIRQRFIAVPYMGTEIVDRSEETGSRFADSQEQICGWLGRIVRDHASCRADTETRSRYLYLIQQSILYLEKICRREDHMK